MSTPSALNARQTLLWDLFDFSIGRGLEIGPLHNKAVPKEHSDVRYLDVFDRDGLLTHHAEDPGVPVENIPEIDYVLLHDGRVRSMVETVGSTTRFDWVMASHVIEHVPDVIGWLQEIAHLVEDGGALVLAVPDRRYCFDLHRPGTSLGQMLQAHELGDTVPSIRAVYDYKRGHASVRAPMVWENNPVGYENRIYSLELVRSMTDRARAGEYIDSHVWLFTPGTFLEQITELRTLGLSEWRVESLVPTKRDELEFYAVLRRLPRGGNWNEALLADEPVPGRLPDWLAETTNVARDLAAARRRVQEVEKENGRLRKRLTQAEPWFALKRRARRVPGLRAAYRTARGRSGRR